MNPVHQRMLARRPSGAVGRPGVNTTLPGGAPGTRQLVSQQCEQSRAGFIASSQTDHPEYVTGTGDQADLTDAGLTAFYTSNPVCAPATTDTTPTGEGTQGGVPAVLAITSPANGATIGTTMPTIAGTAPPGILVRVAVDAGWKTVTSDASGGWSIPWSEIGTGPHVATVTPDANPGNGVSIHFSVATDATGNAGGGGTAGDNAGGGPAAGGGATEAPAGSISPMAAGVGAGAALLVAFLAGR